MDIERLLKIADIVDETPDDNWDMGTWGRETECGTVGCAIGNAWFQGVLPEIEINTRYGIGGLLTHRTATYPAGLFAKGEALNGYDAVADALSIDASAASYLFEPTEYDVERPTPQYEVSKRIRQFVYENENP